MAATRKGGTRERLIFLQLLILRTLREMEEYCYEKRRRNLKRG